MKKKYGILLSAMNAKMDTKKVSVLGCGTMGSGIAIVCLQAEMDTLVLEVSEQHIKEGRARVEGFFNAGIKRGKITEEKKKELLSHLTFTTKKEDLKNCDVIIEAVFENVELKKKTFGELNPVCKPEALFLTNTSVLSVTAIAAGSGRPDKTCGVHFCNPAALMKLVELTRAEQTSDDTYEKTKAFCGHINKIIAETKDTPGFILNFFLIPFNNDCLRLFEAGAASAEDIDKAVKLALGYPMGPFELLDIVGIEVHYAVAMALYDQLKDHRFFPPPIVKRRMEAGLLGKKTGKGFYEYKDKGIFGT